MDAVYRKILLKSDGDVIMLHCGHSFFAPWGNSKEKSNQHRESCLLWLQTFISFERLVHKPGRLKAQRTSHHWPDTALCKFVKTVLKYILTFLFFFSRNLSIHAILLALPWCRSSYSVHVDLCTSFSHKIRPFSARYCPMVVTGSILFTGVSKPNKLQDYLYHNN